MKRISLILAGVFFLSGLYGCQPEQETLSPNIHSSKSKESGHSFPDFLVGTWKADDARWILTFEPDGSISSFRHFVGMDINVAEGGLSEEWRSDVSAVYFLGPCEAVYTPVTHQLDVTIIIEHFTIDFPNGQMTGNFVDYLKGRVSQDPEQWKVSWLSYCTLEGAKAPDPNIIEPRLLTFTKASDENRENNQ